MIVKLQVDKRISARVLYSYRLMKHPFSILRSTSLSAVVLSLTMIALCFSVGEGLRLTPFPLSQGIQVAPATNSSIAGSAQVSVYTYGLLNAPAQLQKRSKRFAIDLACPTLFCTSGLVTRRYPSSEDWLGPISALVLVAFPSDRGPPFTS
jgi:hypothetical protein